MNIKHYLLLAFLVLVSACTPIPVNPDVNAVSSNDWRTSLNNQISSLVVEVVGLQCQNSSTIDRWNFQNYKLTRRENFIIHAVSRQAHEVEYIIKTNAGLPLAYLNIRENENNPTMGCEYNVRLSTGQNIREVIIDSEHWQKNDSFFAVKNFFEYHDTVSVISMPVRVVRRYPRRTIEDRIIEEVAGHIIQDFAVTILCGLITGHDCHHY